jgi:hypothetical protein
MRNLYTTIFTGVVSSALAVSGTTQSASAATIYSNGFETNTTDWQPPATRVASGTNGITSASGSFHAEAGGAPFSRWGGYNYGAGNAVPTAFLEYTTSVDIYLDVASAVANNTPDNTRFDFSSAINTSAGIHFSDFIFNGGFFDDTTAVLDGSPGAGTDRFVFSASNNSQPGSAFAKNPGRSPVAISATGWYTFQHHFYDNAGSLKVDMTISDPADNVVGTWTFNSAAIGTIGGNRYGWFDYNQFPVLAFDNAELNVVPEPASLGLLALGGTALLGRRRRHTVKQK